MRLHAKVLLVVIPLAVVPLLVLGWLAFEQLQSSGVERTSNQMMTLMDQLTRNFQVRTEVAEANVMLFSDSSLMRAYALTEDDEERYLLMLPSLLKLFKSYLRAYPDYYEIRFLLPDGFEDARATLTSIPNFTEEEEDTALFKSLTQSEGETLSRVLFNPDNDEISLQVARPLNLINLATDDPLSTKPELRGYLIVTMNLDFIADQIKANQVGHKGHTLVVDKSGKIIFHHDQTQVGGYIPATLMEAMLGSGQQQGQYRSVYQDDHAVFTTRRLHEDLLLVGVLPESELLQESRSLGETVAWVTTGTVVLTISALLFAMQLLMVRPLKHLVRAVREIGDGNLTPDISLSSRDELGQLALSFQDMGRNLKKSRQKIERLAYHDSLTGLPNRLLFREYLQHMIALARRENSRMAILFLDLDNFKRVNDTLGHQVGDQLLKEMADRLKAALRAEDFVYQRAYQETSEVLARLGGDEFIILLPKVNDSHDAAKVASRILEIMKEPFRFDGHELYNGTSIGITLFPSDGTEVNDLIKRADVAMYHAKEQGRNNFQFYSASYNQATSEHLSLESRLRRAIDNEELELYYQPQVQADTGNIVGLEALLRWNDPEHGIISPDQFIPIAEDSGLILPIGEWVLREACRQSCAWKDAGLPRVFVSVNVSGIQLQRQDLQSIVVQTLSETGLEPELLELEVTETTLMKVTQEVIDHLAEMKQKGLTISLDDFGTGYSSLNRLRELPIGKLKIDRSFVQGMITDPQDAAIVSAILDIARSMGLKTTAEGVETAEQAARLAEDRCDYLQGYLLSHPVPAGDVAELLKKDFRSTSYGRKKERAQIGSCL
ncbi:MAG: EAL domain-containing protein [Sedimenticolaceae bacterium]